MSDLINFENIFNFEEYLGRTKLKQIFCACLQTLHLFANYTIVTNDVFNLLLTARETIFYKAISTVCVVCYDE